MTDDSPHITEYRCRGCSRLLLRGIIPIGGMIDCKCPRCGKHFIYDRRRGDTMDTGSPGAIVPDASKPAE